MRFFWVPLALCLLAASCTGSMAKPGAHAATGLHKRRRLKSTVGTQSVTFLQSDAEAAESSTEIPAALNSTRSVHSRVQFGQEVRRDQFPYMSVLYYDSDHKVICGATLISPQVLLTAAQCVYDRESQELTPPVSIRVGAQDLVGARTGELRGWKAIEVPEGYMTASEYRPYDMALIVLDQEVTTADPVNLATADRRIQPWRVLTVAGFGNWNPTSSNQLAPTLRAGAVSYLTPGICKKYSPLSTPPENNLCAGLVATATDACPGDSGSPLLIWLPEASKHVQVGIVTFGPRCFIADSDFFPVGYYTSVMAWRDWIDEVVTSKYGFAPL